MLPPPPAINGETGPKAEASAQALVDFREFITSTYPAFTAATSREIVSDYSLVFTWKGTDESLKPVLLMSHMDVVPVVPGTEGNWTHPPFAGEIAEGIVWGRGAIDCKDSLITMLKALAPAMPFVQRMAFANLWLFEPVVQGAMEKTPSLAAQLHTTIAPTMINARIKENVLPPEASGIMNFRLHQRDTIESATAHVVKAIGDDKVDVEQEGSARDASAISNLNGESYSLLRQSITHSYPGALVTPNLTVPGTDSRYYLPITENVFRFIPIRVDASELARFHATNERVRVASLAEAVSFYTSLMQNLDAPDL